MSSNPMKFMECRLLDGQGTIGKVYVVHQSPADGGGKYAMRKIHLPQQTSSSTALRVLRECQGLCQLHHPHLLRMEAAFFEENIKNCICQVMEYCGNGTLFSYVMKQQENEILPEEKILKWLSQIVMALSYLHEKNIVHGDVRAKNVFLWPNEDTCKLSDMRTLAILMDNSVAFEKCPVSLNSARHFPPSFWQVGGINNNVRNYFTRTGDMFSLGCLLYFLCCKEDAIDCATFESISEKVSENMTPSIPEGYSQDVHNLVSKLLDSNSERRPTVTTIMKHPRFQELCASSVSLPQKESPPSRRTALEMKRLRLELLHLSNAYPIECDPVTKTFTVSWTNLTKHMSDPLGSWSDIINAEFPANLRFPMLILPEEFDHVMGRPMVLWADLQRQGDEMVIYAKLHEKPPENCEVPVSLQITVLARLKKSQKSQQQGGNEAQDCEITGEDVAALGYSSFKMFIVMDHLSPVPWDQLDQKHTPQVHLTIRHMPETKFWYKGFSPIEVLPGSTAFPTVDWASLKGIRFSLKKWDDMISRTDVVTRLFLPPMRFAFLYKGNLREIFLVVFIVRTDNYLTCVAYPHPNTPKELKSHPPIVCLRLKVDIWLQQGEVHSLYCEKTVFRLPSTKYSKEKDELQMQNMWSFFMHPSVWDAVDLSRLPVMTVHQLELPEDSDEWFLGLSPLNAAQGTLKVDWNTLGGTNTSQSVWAKMLTSCGSPSYKNRLSTPVIFATPKYPLLFSLGRQSQNLKLFAMISPEAILKARFPAMEIHVHVQLYLTQKDATVTTESKSATCLMREMLDLPLLTFTVPKWHLLCPLTLPKIHLKVSSKSVK